MHLSLQKMQFPEPHKKTSHAVHGICSKSVNISDPGVHAVCELGGDILFPLQESEERASLKNIPPERKPSSGPCQWPVHSDSVIRDMVQDEGTFPGAFSSSFS